MAQRHGTADGADSNNRWTIWTYLQSSLGLCLIAAAIILLATDPVGSAFPTFFLALFAQFFAAARSNALGWTKDMEREPSAEARRGARFGQEASALFVAAVLIAATWPLRVDQPITVMPYTLLAIFAVVSGLSDAVAGAYLIWFTNPPPPNDDFW